MKQIVVSSFSLVGLILLLNVSVAGQKSSHATPDEKCEPPIFKPNEVSVRAKITFRPEPTYTEKARVKNIKGKVTMDVVLCQSGSVTDITVIEGLPQGLTEQAIDAARRIKFEPAVKDSKQVPQMMRLEYFFNVFPGRGPKLAQPPFAGRMIEAVGISGLRTHQGNEIWGHLQTRNGQPFSDEKIQADLRMLRTVDYLDPKAIGVRVEEWMNGGVRVMFEVKERDTAGAPPTQSPRP
jgi:TonB family protein